MTLEERFGHPHWLQLHLCRRRQQRLPLPHAHRRAARRPLHRRHAEELCAQADIVAQAAKSPTSPAPTSPSYMTLSRPLKDADAIYTDVCTSMGFEHEATKRAPIFKPYQVNEALMAHAAPQPSSCTACPRTAMPKSPTPSSTGRSRSSSTRPKTACTPRRLPPHAPGRRQAAAHQSAPRLAWNHRP